MNDYLTNYANMTLDEITDDFMRDPRAEAALLGFKGDLRDLIREVVQTVRDVAERENN